MGWTTADLPSMDGQRVVVTGANSGIGRAGTRAFARAGATVVMACRSLERGEQAAADIRREVTGADLVVEHCDLADLDSVASFADRVRGDRLDVLCNNAGMMAIPRQETADGFEMQFGVNHLGHFALTGHLLETLVTTDGESRVVTQSSGAHENGHIDFDDLHGEESYGRWSAYSQSKLANVLFAYELDRRLDDAGIDGVCSVACHPGYADTNLQSKMVDETGSRIMGVVTKLGNRLVAQSPEKGALPMLYAATADDVSGGEYYGPAGLLNARGLPEKQRSSTRSYDEAVADRLWAVSQEATGVSYRFEELTATA